MPRLCFYNEFEQEVAKIVLASVTGFVENLELAVGEEIIGFYGSHNIYDGNIASLGFIVWTPKDL